MHERFAVIISPLHIVIPVHYVIIVRKYAPLEFVLVSQTN